MSERIVLQNTEMSACKIFNVLVFSFVNFHPYLCEQCHSLYIVNPIWERINVPWSEILDHTAFESINVKNHRPAHKCTCDMALLNCSLGLNITWEILKTVHSFFVNQHAPYTMTRFTRWHKKTLLIETFQASVQVKMEVKCPFVLYIAHNRWRPVSYWHGKITCFTYRNQLHKQFEISCKLLRKVICCMAKNLL